MRRFIESWLRVGLLSLLLLPVSLRAADNKKAGKAAPPPALSKLGWLAGNWRLEKNGRVVDEQWMAPAGGAMLGMARTVAKGREQEHSFLQIREGPGGKLFFVTQTTGQSEAAYQVLSLVDNAVVFENRQLEFPQKISYEFQADGSLRVTEEGPGVNGQVRRVENVYDRVGS